MLCCDTSHVLPVRALEAVLSLNPLQKQHAPATYDSNSPTEHANILGHGLVVICKLPQEQQQQALIHTWGGGPRVEQLKEKQSSN